MCSPVRSTTYYNPIVNLKLSAYNESFVEKEMREVGATKICSFLEKEADHIEDNVQHCGSLKYMPIVNAVCLNGIWYPA